MIVKFLFSAPKGDIPAGPDDLVKPFKITPSENHPFLTLGDYFKSLKSFILKDNGIALSHVVGKRLGEDIDITRINRMLIRSEKHGVLYHLASIEIFTGNQSYKLAVSTAVSEKGKSWLAHEYDMLNFLDRTFNLPYLPKPYFKGDVKRPVGIYKETLSMFVAQWFEGYHEWHFSLDESEQKHKIRIWDQECGHRFASQAETFEIFRQASKILTLFYDTENFSEVFPWHHAAGDFVVRCRNGVIDVKLTTARNYKSCMVFESQSGINPMVAIIWFFLNMTIKMRLDKVDGVGEMVWAGHYCVEAATMGFFEALHIMEGKGRYHLGKVIDLLLLLKAFSREELGRLFFSVLDFYGQEDPADFSLIKTNLESHVNRLCRVLQGFRL
jgi:hypothetical protein